MELPNLIDAFRGPLIGLIVSWGAPWVDATEIAQDSFAEAYLKRHACHGDWSEPDNFGPWLRGVALNVFRNWQRGRRRRERVVKFESPLVEVAAAGSEPRPSLQVEQLRSVIERLPDNLRQVVLMHYLEETPVRQTALLLNLSEKAVEGRLYQARRALRQMLTHEPPAAQISQVIVCL